MPAREGAGTRNGGDRIVLAIAGLNPVDNAGSCHSSAVKALEPSLAGTAFRLPLPFADTALTFEFSAAGHIDQGASSEGSSLVIAFTCSTSWPGNHPRCGFLGRNVH